MDRGAWWAAVYGVSQSRTRLKQLTMHACIGEGNGNPLQDFPGMEEPGGLPSMGLYRIRRDWSNLAIAAAATTASNQVSFSLCWCLVTKSCLTLCDPMGCRPGSSVHGISQARIMEWVAISFSRGTSQPWEQIYVSCIGRQILYHWATWEAPSFS